MPRNNADKAERDAIDRRREVVARLRLQGLTEREITEALPEHGILNPDTDKPYDITTIHRDITALVKQWRDNAAGDISEHRGKLLAELEEVRRQCAASGELKAWISAMNASAKILGVAQERIDITSNGQPVKAYVGVDPEGV